MTANAGEDGEAAEEQWTRIVRKGKGKNKNQQHSIGPTTTGPPTAGPAENFHPNANPKLSAADITAEHDKLTSKWRTGSCYARLRALVQAHAAAGAIVRRAVCLGLGAFEPVDGSWVARRRSHVQLAAFLGMVELMEAASGEKIECFYQEPRFAQPDKDFIASLGGSVVESPASYALVDDTTMVYGVHLYRDIWAAALEKHLPAVFVGTGWDVWDGTGAGESRDFDRIREMEDGAAFGRFAFPQDEDDAGAFSSTCVYWRRREEEEEGEVDGTEALERAVAGLDLAPGENAEDEKGEMP